MKNFSTLAQAQAEADAVLINFNGASWDVYEPGDTLPPAPPESDVPPEVTMRQARLALNAIGKLASVDSAIAAMADPAKTQAQIEWEYSSTVQRTKPLVLQLGAALGLSSADLDQLFITAAEL
jgi:hypothetical protein